MKWNSKIRLKGRVEIFYSPCSLRINISTEKKHILYSWKIDFWKVNASKTLWVILKLACNLLYKDMNRAMGSWVGGMCEHFLQFLSVTQCAIHFLKIILTNVYIDDERLYSKVWIPKVFSSAMCVSQNIGSNIIDTTQLNIIFKYIRNLGMICNILVSDLTLLYYLYYRLAMRIWASLHVGGPLKNNPCQENRV